MKQLSKFTYVKQKISVPRVGSQELSLVPPTLLVPNFPDLVSLHALRALLTVTLSQLPSPPPTHTPQMR